MTKIHRVYTVVLLLMFIVAMALPLYSQPKKPSVAAPGSTPTLTEASYLPPWNFMSRSTSGVDTFLLEHPTYDGRGVLLLIFDTGVDMSIPGLERTSTGQVKVIDAIDFSGSNIVRFERATLAAQSPLVASAPQLPVVLRDIASLDPKPVDDEIYIGYINEHVYRNASVRDFDGDGASTSMFGALLYRSVGGWRVVLDTDADSSLTNETPVANFAESQQTIKFQQPNNTRRETPLTFSATIDTTNKIASFHYDMGGHGTHVAGIAAGYGINGEPGFNGIAPGAQIISGKFSADSAKDITVTGSMMRAYEYAARLADSLQQLHTPVVVNMSFGIGSAYEGRADIEQFLDTLTINHPNLYIVTSAGNEGPGLSSVGIPAATQRLITVGALLPHGIGRDSYGASLDHDILWDFSSRGGEVAKPDVVAPGTAISTITRFAHESRASGTSMASPYTAGVVALLLSAMRQEDSTWIPSQALMRRALRYSAVPMPNVSPIEQGGGVLNVRRAYELLRQYRRNGFADDVQEYSISTFSPNYPDQRGPTAFWRSSWVPDENWRQTFTISRVLPRRKDIAHVDQSFFRAYTLESNASWLKLVQKNIYLRNDGIAQVDVTYDAEKMREPGLYSGRIIARRASARGKAADQEVEFDLVNTVIVPYHFDASKGFNVTTPQQKLDAGNYYRYYFAPPSGAAAITFTLGVPKGSKSNVAGWIMNRNGIQANYLPRVKGSERSEASNTVAMSELGNGIIEVVVQADAFEGAGGQSEFTLSATAMMMTLETEIVTNNNGTRTLELSATNTGNDMVRGNLSYTVKGYGRILRDTMRGDTYSMPLVLRKQDGALWITPRFANEDYQRSTDILAQIVDHEGNVQSQQPFNQPSEWLFLPNFDRDADSTHFTLQIIFGSARYDSLPDIPIEIVEHHVRPSNPNSLGGYGTTELVPYVPQIFQAELPEQPDQPAGYYGIGEASFRPLGSDQSVTFEFRVE